MTNTEIAFTLAKAGFTPYPGHEGAMALLRKDTLFLLSSDGHGWERTHISIPGGPSISLRSRNIHAIWHADSPDGNGTTGIELGAAGDNVITFPDSVGA